MPASGTPVAGRRLVALPGTSDPGPILSRHEVWTGQTATVVGVDVRQEKLDLAKRLGATYTVDAAAGDPAEAIQAPGGADVAVALTVDPGRDPAGARLAAARGRLILVSPARCASRPRRSPAGSRR